MQTSKEVERCNYYLAHWQDSVKFWERMGAVEFKDNLALARRQVRRFQTKLQWANLRAALYTVKK